MTVPLKIKVRDIVIGFFGWIIFDNLLFILTINILLLFIATICLATVITPIVLYNKKRIWVSAGIISAVIINASIWMYVLYEPNTRIQISSLITGLFPYPLAGVLGSQ